jgi:D-glycero-D-manno-heptose 1,7-bisphosphate phosphatase
MVARAVFLDLNGTLVMPVKVMSPAEYRLLPTAGEAIRLLNEAGFLCPVVTVQSRIAKGLYSEDDFCEWFRGLQDKLRSQGAEIVGPYVCPHRLRGNCACQKPRSTLYLQAARDLDIDCTRSYIAGDSWSDLEAAAAIGAVSCLVLTGQGKRTQNEVGVKAGHVAPDILQAARWVIEH